MHAKEAKGAAAMDGGTPVAAGGFPGPASAALIEELGRYVIADVKPFVVDLERCEG
ncbi:MAG: hypothetical protein GX774_13000, partial [Armatimonadetes bacterium]|nr:hypothetical protein [Armatimonadota bacterium]